LPEQSGYISIEITPFVFEHGQNMFAVGEQKFKERSLGVERIASHQVEGTD